MSEGGSKVDTVYKVVLVGHKKSAKTSAIIALQGLDNEQVTVSPAFSIYTLQVRDKNVQLHFWDTSGMEGFLSLIGLYFRGSHVVLLCFSTYAPEDHSSAKRLGPHGSHARSRCTCRSSCNLLKFPHGPGRSGGDGGAWVWDHD